MAIETRMYIDGQWVESSDGAQLDVINPATEEVIYQIPKAAPADLDRALAAADRSWREWREVDAWSRSSMLRHVADILRERAAEIARALTEEQGKTITESNGEVNAAADQFDWYADEARRIYGRMIDGHSREHRLMVIRQPVGPVAAFSPWNFPCLLSARKIAPALAAGCSIIVKPAEEAPRATLAIAEACAVAGVPAGLVNVVLGDPAQISAHLIQSPVIRKVSLTGSVPVGQQLLKLAAEGVKSISMELGGHAPVLVFEDADIAEAARICARGKFRNNGQVCICASRFYVQESVLDEFTSVFVDETAGMKIGNGADADTDLGPLSNLRRLEATEALVQNAVQQGARVAYGGKRPAGITKGYFYEPTVLTHTTAAMQIMNSEPFCPIAPITAFRDLEDGIQKANQSEYGLAGYIFTRNTRTAFLAAEQLDVGMVGINNLVIATAEIPFGGIKKSGFGREGGAEGIESYTVTKYINFKL